jgi:cation diffusion facilitator family transporter
MIDTLRRWRRRIRTLLNRDRPEYASTVSLIACSILAIGSIVIGVMENSLIVQTNGYIALIDIGNSLLFLAAVERSSRSADVTFNYGYGKYESLAILVSANLLVVLTIITAADLFSAANTDTTHGSTLYLTAWSVASFVVMRGAARTLERSAERFHMPMLRYDADLWRVDSWVEIGVLAEILLVGALAAQGYSSAVRIIEGVSAFALLAISLKVPLTHGREALQQLLDRTLPDELQYSILGVISENMHRLCAFKGVHTRQSGKDIFIEIDVVMPYDYTLERLYHLERTMLDALHETFPTAIPRVYVTPCDKSCERSGSSTCPVKAAAAGLRFGRSD